MSVPNEAEIRLWDKLFPYDTNTGCVTRNTPTLDVDITNKDACNAIFLRIQERFEERGHVLVRVGNSPKFAVPFRTDTPFKKIKAEVVSPGGEVMKFEFLGDGQQFVVSGRHPDTGKAYQWWPNAPQKDLTNVKHDELPYIDEAGARALVEELVELVVRDCGFTRPEKKSRAREGADHGGKRVNGGGKTTAYGRKVLDEELERGPWRREPRPQQHAQRRRLRGLPARRWWGD